MTPETKPDKSAARRVINRTVIVAALFGVILVILAAYYVEAMAPKSGSFSSAFAAGVTTIGISLIGLAIFSLALETKDWREYFSERLREVVIDSEYLNTLDAEALKGLQIKVLKAQFKNQAIDSQGSFLSYFNTNLHGFISSPYREDVTGEVIVKECRDDAECFFVKDKVRYVCKASAGKILPHIGWKADNGEFRDIKSLRICVQFPFGHADAGKPARELRVLEGTDIHDKLKEGIEISLKDYETIDGLVVLVEANYIVERGKFQYWQMSQPTKNFDITIVYPDNYDIQFKTLVLDDVVSKVTNEPGYLKFGYGTWTLPQSGLTWLLMRKTKPTASDASCGAQASTGPQANTAGDRYVE